MDNDENNSIVGKCLAATPWVDDERFEKAIIYVCSHNKNGAIGFVFNHQLKEYSFSDLALSLPIDHQKIADTLNLSENPLYEGGPVEKIRGFVLHSPEYVREDTILVKNKIAISSSVDIITDIAFGIGPKENLIALGYVAWGPNQLEKEIINNRWIVTKPSSELIFRTKDEDKWQKALDESGIDVSRMLFATGNV